MSNRCLFFAVVAAVAFLAVVSLSPHNIAIAFAEAWLAVFVWTALFILLVYRPWIKGRRF